MNAVFTLLFFEYLSNYCDKICEYDEHPIAGLDIQYRAPDSLSEYTTPLEAMLLDET